MKKNSRRDEKKGRKNQRLEYLDKIRNYCFNFCCSWNFMVSGKDQEEEAEERRRQEERRKSIQKLM